ncbi:MAG: hypothetical protein HQL49_03685 [Gammaproteobacteria bacterium]|nr:hypothetical protein [Gammaproteobacteria bacterium]
MRVNGTLHEFNEIRSVHKQLIPKAPASRVIVRHHKVEDESGGFHWEMSLKAIGK